MPYGTDDWSDAHHHDYAFELERVVRALSEGLLHAFSEWISQIAIPTGASLTSPKARIDPSARFITFNYTATLQQLHGVPSCQVWHIHGAAAGKEPLVLGHGRRLEPEERFSACLDPEHADTRAIEGARIIDNYFERSFKPTAQIIAENAVRFARLADVDDIRVLGHSLSDVDLPYLEKVAANVRPGAVWRISTHGDPKALQDQLARITLPASATFWPLPEV